MVLYGFNGAMLTGYQKIENQWYYFNKSLKKIPNGALSYTGVTSIMGNSTVGQDRVTVVEKMVASSYIISQKVTISGAPPITPNSPTPFKALLGYNFPLVI